MPSAAAAAADLDADVDVGAADADADADAAVVGDADGTVVAADGLVALRRPENTSKLPLGRVPIMSAMAASSLYSAAPASTLSAQHPTQ